MIGIHEEVRRRAEGGARCRKHELHAHDVARVEEYAPRLSRAAAHGCAGGRKDDQARTYFRYMCDVDVVNSKQQILELFNIFHQLVVRVVVDPAPEPGTAVAEFFEELQGHACVDFAS